MKYPLQNAESFAEKSQRTCIATRVKRPPEELLRCVAEVAPDGTVQIVPDPGRRLPGRGAWITPTREAVATADQRRAFHRALRVGAEAKTQAVRDYVCALDSAGAEIDDEHMTKESSRH